MNNAERTTMGLRFEVGEDVPQAGDTVVMRGMYAYYAISIHRVKKVRKHPKDGATLMNVDCTRRTVFNMSLPEDDEPEDDDPQPSEPELVAQALPGMESNHE